MDTKIQEITDKIYREGVEKGSAEAEKITGEALARAEEALATARREAEEIVSSARKEADTIKQHTEAELKLYATRAVETLKSEITNLVAGRVAESNVAAATADPAFMQNVILEISRRWADNGTTTIQTEDAAQLTNYFAANAKELLNKSVNIEHVNGKHCTFTVVPAEGEYKIVFGNEEFSEFFRDFLRPQLSELLFK
jgi:V/A-type H+-transporting ATPase subunit E